MYLQYNIEKENRGKTEAEAEEKEEFIRFSVWNLGYFF
jgi:hypothetical protein